MRFLLFVLPLLGPLTLCAQQRDRPLQTSLRYVATEGNAPPGTCGCFFLQGAAMDIALPVAPWVSAVVDVAGGTINRLPSGPRGLSEITLLAGPRYTHPLGRMHLNTQALFGAVRGFDSDFIVTPAVRTDTSTNFAMALGASLDLPMTQNLSVRAVQVDYMQSNLPNGVDNRQRNIRLGAGVVLRFHLPTNQR